MIEELIRQCAREGAASEYEALGLIGMASNFLSGAMDDATDVRSAERALRLYHARAVAPLEQDTANLRELLGRLLPCAEYLHEEDENLGELIVEVKTALAPFQQAGAAPTMAQAAADVLAVLEGEPAPMSAARPAAVRSLTSRQVEVLRLIGNGKPNAAIATALGMSENTVRIHVSAILKTLGLSNRTEAALWWRENGESAR